MTRNIKSQLGSRNNVQQDIKPSDVFGVKLQTQQLLQKIRQQRTQLSRINDRITSQTNAINKTFEQQTDTPAVTTNHTNSVTQLQRSINSAQNTLNSLRKEIDKARRDDKTFAVKEMQEEVKILYSEYTRLNNEFNEGKNVAQSYDKLRSNAEYKVSSQNFSSLKGTIRELKEQISSLSSKAQAYSSKKAKLDMEHDLSKRSRSGIPSTEELRESILKLSEEVKQHSEELENQKNEHLARMKELHDIISAQKSKISERLANLENEEHGVE